MILGNLNDKNHNQKIFYALLGFSTVFLIIFLFNFLATKIPGIKDNYISFFCTNTYGANKTVYNNNKQVDKSSSS